MSYDVVSLVPTFCESFPGRMSFEEGTIAYHECIPLEKIDYSIASLHHLESVSKVMKHERSDERAA
jgi:hypothetical protein